MAVRSGALARTASGTVDPRESIPHHQGSRRSPPGQGAQGLRARRGAGDPGEPGDGEDAVPARSRRSVGSAPGRACRGHGRFRSAAGGARGEPRSAARLGDPRVGLGDRHLLRRQHRRTRAADGPQGVRGRHARIRSRYRGVQPEPRRQRARGPARGDDRMGMAYPGSGGCERQPARARERRGPRRCPAHPPPARSRQPSPASAPARRGGHRDGRGRDARSSCPHRGGCCPSRARRARRCRSRGGDRGPDAPARFHSALSRALRSAGVAPRVLRAAHAAPARILRGRRVSAARDGDRRLRPVGARHRCATTAADRPVAGTTGRSPAIMYDRLAASDADSPRHCRALLSCRGPSGPRRGWATQSRRPPLLRGSGDRGGET